jgi:hypothetical protein
MSLGIVYRFISRHFTLTSRSFPIIGDVWVNPMVPFVIPGTLPQNGIGILKPAWKVLG